ncbi:sulfide dehydrogenase (flavoprotein) subunit SudA [Leptolinea tardivitalis]|nr:NADPH-dependent glutamate synthase [Leptolinea tardivitalis]GAP20649.1 sulfide dehydrogenase (flavoprotein) subunit SudA [Leptolinea tardivitalis]
MENSTSPAPKKMNLQRVEMSKQKPEVRRQNFDEVAFGYTPEEAMAEASRCLDCKKPGCVGNCPVEVNIPDFIRCIKAGDFAEGIRIIRQKNCLPAVTGRVCPQEEQCEGGCVFAKRGGQIAIGRLERFLADWEASQGINTGSIKKPRPTGRKVAVIGGGPAGLTVAGDLIQLGHQVTVYEALHKVGGVLVYGIPEFRLPKRIVRREVDYLTSLGVEMVTSYVVGKTRTVDSLLEEYDAIFVGSGAGLPWFMEIPGNNLNGVYSANEYLTRMNLMKGYTFPSVQTPIKQHHRVAVIGGGNVAMDCARTALRLGAEAHIVYRRSRQELPARLEEVENAEEEGVIFDFLTLPLACLGNENSWVTGLSCQKMELGEPDASGRRSPVAIPGSEFVMPVDAIIYAIGNSPNPLIPSTTPGLAIGRKGNIEAEEATGKTSKARVWAGGDVVTGAATVILAMGAGRKAARAIHRYLQTLEEE